MDLEHPAITKINQKGEFTPEKFCGTDAIGDDILEGDYILEYEGEIILESNAIDFLVDFLGAKRKVAGENE